MDNINVDIITKNINKMTNKEKVCFIQTLLGTSVQMAKFLGAFQEKCFIPLPHDIHYFMMIAMANLVCLSKDDNPIEISDYSLKSDSYEEKLISFLKKLNMIYKEKLDDR